MAPGLRPYYPRARTASGPSIAETTRSRTHRSESPTSTPSPDPPDSTFPEIENSDPTYGLRPEGLPIKSVFRSFGRLFAKPGRGLADLAEESADEDDDVVGDGGTSYDMVDWEDTVPGLIPEASVLGDNPPGSSSGVEYETVPAVDGGTVTRPRVFHAHSQVQSRVSRPASLVSTRSRLTRRARAITPRGPPTSPSFAIRSIPPTSRRASTRTQHTHSELTPPRPIRSPNTTAILLPASPRRIALKHAHARVELTYTHALRTNATLDRRLTAHATRTRLRTGAHAPRLDHKHEHEHGPRHGRAHRTAARASRRALDARNARAFQPHPLSVHPRTLPLHSTLRPAHRTARTASRMHALGAAAAAKAQEEVDAAARGDSEDEGTELVSPPSEFDAEDMDR
ncbi:hypothetical protein BJY52DRAFT_134550 [Lactarius psammicola]|nr:hypothetical protein BJY52DRAFT_134550 [Lactarius psammicola]